MTNLFHIRLQSLTEICAACVSDVRKSQWAIHCLSITQHFYLGRNAHIQFFLNSILELLNTGCPPPLHSEFAQPPAQLAAYGTDYHRRRYHYMTILFMTFFITNICWFLLYPHFILKVDHWQNNSHSAKRQIKTATVISALQRKTLRHLTVYFVTAATKFQVPST